jgi:hypothetical protein
MLAQYRAKLPPSLRTILSSAAVRAFLVSALLYALALAYCRHAFWRDPRSAFFRGDHANDLKYSAIRHEEGLGFVARANNTGTPSYIPILAGSDPTLCAAFVTVKRGEHEYLDASVGSMLAGLTHEEREHLYLSILFADTDPSVHPNWKHPWIRALADEVDGYTNVSDDKIEEILQAEKGKNYYVKRPLCVQRCKMPG